MTLALAMTARAQPFDLAVAGVSAGDCCITPLHLDLLEFTGAAARRFPEVAAIAAAGQGRIVAAGTDGSLFIIEPSFARTAVRSAVAGVRPSAVVADRNGNIYLFVRTGAAPRLLAIRADGTLRYDIPFDDATAVDLAADQCTVVYNGSGGVRRFDVCTGTPHAGVVQRIDASEGLRILPDSGLLVSSGRTLWRYDAAGALARTYALPPFSMNTTLALGAAGATALIGQEESELGSGVLEVSLASGAVVRHVPLDLQDMNSIVAHDGWAAAHGALGTAAVPAVSTYAMLVLVASIGFVAVRRLV